MLFFHIVLQTSPLMKLLKIQGQIKNNSLLHNPKLKTLKRSFWVSLGLSSNTIVKASNAMSVLLALLFFPCFNVYSSSSSSSFNSFAQCLTINVLLPLLFFLYFRFKKCFFSFFFYFSLSPFFFLQFFPLLYLFIFKQDRISTLT